jgi:hypothetical protein
LELQNPALRIRLRVKAWGNAANWFATAGAIVFILALFLSAYWEPGIRWLHFFQSWMYVAAIALIWNRSNGDTSWALELRFFGITQPCL